MLSMPPATITSCVPASSMSCANIAAFMPEPHILDSVTAPALMGSPPLSAACRAGAWPCPAIRQLPNSTSPTRAGATPERSMAALMAAPPRSWAESEAKSPWNAPMGVRAAPTMTIESAIGADMNLSSELRCRYFAVKNFRHGVNHNVITDPIASLAQATQHYSPHKYLAFTRQTHNVDWSPLAGLRCLLVNFWPRIEGRGGHKL